MSNDTTVEARLAKVEHAVSDLQRMLNGAVQKENWIEAVTGSITDEEAFVEALQYGREFRQADRPEPPNEPRP
ncbi:MAG: transferase hexapeptide repeat containing protein [Planctomycetes bacterium]|nr:transferase hexapeptide repeat containing protein [Planctomycetota bacterium]